MSNCLAGEPNDQNERVQQNKQVTMHFSLSLDRGSESEKQSGSNERNLSSNLNDPSIYNKLTTDSLTIDSTLDKDPVTFVVGDGNLPASFEKSIIGLKVGDSRSVVLTPEEGFGSHREENVQRFKREQFEKMSITIPLEPGMVINFTDAARGEVPGVVKSIEAQYVVIDFNHPLAGKSLNFQVEILAVEEPVSLVKMV